MTDINHELKEQLKEYFKPKGIVAYSCCCRWGCTGSYDEDDDDFQVRDTAGIFYIRFHLDGMNYRQDPTWISAYYDDHSYLMEHWDEEVDLVDNFCRILGLQRGDYEINKPEDQSKCVGIILKAPVKLDPLPSFDEDEEEDEEENVDADAAAAGAAA